MLASMRREVPLWKARTQLVELSEPSRVGERAAKGEASEQQCVGKQERWLLVVQDSSEVWGHQSVVASIHSVGQLFFFF